MPSAKGDYGNHPNIGFVRPSEEELNAMYGEIENIIGNSLTDLSKKIIRKLLTFYRNDLVNQKKFSTVANVKVELEHLKSLCQKIVELLDANSGRDLNHFTRHMVTLELINTLKVGEDDVLYRLGTSAEDAIELTDLALSRIERKRGAPRNKNRDMIFAELARLCDEVLKIEPTKYEEGKFSKILQIFIDYAHPDTDESYNDALNMKHLYPIIERAINTYKTTKKSVLIWEDVVFPSLT